MLTSSTPAKWLASTTFPSFMLVRFSDGNDARHHIRATAWRGAEAAKEVRFLGLGGGKVSDAEKKHFG